MKHNIIVTIFTAILLSQTVGAQSLQQSIETIISDPALAEATIGICARTGDGVTLAEIDSDNMIMPASNMKLISTGTALHRLGPEHQLITEIAHDGKIEKGVLKGNLYIIGGIQGLDCHPSGAAFRQLGKNHPRRRNQKGRRICNR